MHIFLQPSIVVSLTGVCNHDGGVLNALGLVDSNLLVQNESLIQVRIRKTSTHLLDDLNVLLPRRAQEEPAPRQGTLKPEERLVYDAIGDTETPIDAIISKSDLPSGRVSSTLLVLEMKRLVKQLPGQHFIKLG